MKGKKSFYITNSWPEFNSKNKRWSSWKDIQFEYNWKANLDKQIDGYTLEHLSNSCTINPLSLMEYIYGN